MAKLRSKSPKDKKIRLSLALASYNEEENIGPCLEAVKDWVDEMVVVDGSSDDKTVEIAKKHGAKVIITDNPPIFHINKQKALEACKGEWILQLDADERVSEKLADEIKKMIMTSDKKIQKYQKTLPDRKLFIRHQKLLENRDGKIGGEKGEYAGFLIPRFNYFLGKYLRFGGVYPDGVIRLVKKNKAHFPCQSVHEQIEVDGQVGWLQNSLLHFADTTFRKYLYRNSKYIDLITDDLRKERVKKNLFQLINYFLFKPVHWFLLTQIRHKGILDGYQGIIFSFFSALRFPRAYWRYLTGVRKII